MKLTFIVVDPSKLLVVLLLKLTQKTVCRTYNGPVPWMLESCFVLYTKRIDGFEMRELDGVKHQKD